MRALQNSFVLLKGYIILKVANEVRVITEAMRTCHIRLPLGHILRLYRLCILKKPPRTSFLFQLYVKLETMYNLMEINVLYFLKMF